MLPMQMLHRFWQRLLAVVRLDALRFMMAQTG
jgi:hypothetical protein